MCYVRHLGGTLMYDDLTELLKIMMSKAMKLAAMKGKSNALIQISLDDDNFLSAANVDIGFSTKATLKSLERKGKGKIPDQKFMHFQNDCRAFFKGFIEKKK